MDRQMQHQLSTKDIQKGGVATNLETLLTETGGQRNIKLSERSELHFD